MPIVYTPPAPAASPIGGVYNGLVIESVAGVPKAGFGGAFAHNTSITLNGKFLDFDGTGSLLYGGVEVATLNDLVNFALLNAHNIFTGTNSFRDVVEFQQEMIIEGYINSSGSVSFQGGLIRLGPQPGSFDIFYGGGNTSANFARFGIPGTIKMLGDDILDSADLKFLKSALNTAGSIPFFNGTVIDQDNANFFWDNVLKQLGIGTNTFPTLGFVRMGAGANSDTYNGLAISPVLIYTTGTSINGANIETRVTLGAALTQRVRGLKGVALVDAAGFTASNTGGGMMGIEGVARLQGTTGLIVSAGGGYFRVLSDAPGGATNVITNVSGIDVVTNDAGNSIFTYSMGGNFYSQQRTGSTNSFIIVMGTLLGNGSVAPTDGAVGNWALYNYSTLPNYFAGKVGIGTGGVATTPGAWLELKAGLATAGNAPLKFNSGPLLTTPVPGVEEFLTDRRYFTQTTGPTRQTYAFLSDIPAGPALLANVTGINAKATGNTAIYVVPAGKTLIVTQVIIRCIAAVAITTGITASLISTTGTIYGSTAMAALTAANNTYMFENSGNSVSPVAADTVNLNIGTAAIGTSQTVSCMLIGFLI